MGSDYVGGGAHHGAAQFLGIVDARAVGNERGGGCDLIIAAQIFTSEGLGFRV
jgi:hypothetical protein